MHRVLQVLQRKAQSYLPRVPISSGQSRPTTPPPPPKKKTDSSRFVPINAQTHDFKPAFCLFSLFFGWNSSFFCVFWPFFMYPSVLGRYPNKKTVYSRALFWLKCSFSCHFPLNARNFVYIFYWPLFSWSKMRTVHSEIFFPNLFDFKRMVSHSISPKFSGKIPYVLSKPRNCFLGSNNKSVLC